MVVCRFYQQGRCKFGSDCRNEHQGSRNYYDDHTYSPSPQVDRYHYVKPQTDNAASIDPKQHIRQILEIVRQDITTAEKGGQWPFSCYAPMKEYNNIDGLQDISPEELRFQMYSSREAGSLDECNRLVQENLQTIQLKWNLLKSSSGEAYNIVQSILKKDDSLEQFAASNSVFGGPPAYASSIFGGSSAPATGGSSHTSSIFGGSTNVLPPTGLFAAAAAAQNSSPFSSLPVQPPTGLFGAAAAAHSSSTFFSPTAAQPPTGLFGAAAAAVAHQSSLFGGAPVQQTSVFGSSNSTQSAIAFGAPPVLQSASVFGGSNQSSSIFGSAPQISSNQGFGSFDNVQSSGLFHSLGASNEQHISGKSECSVYSAMEDLREDVLAEFKAQIFVMGKVPTIPPPKNLCC